MISCQSPVLRHQATAERCAPPEVSPDCTGASRSSPEPAKANRLYHRPSLYGLKSVVLWPCSSEGHTGDVDFLRPPWVFGQVVLPPPTARSYDWTAMMIETSPPCTDRVTRSRLCLDGRIALPFPGCPVCDLQVSPLHAPVAQLPDCCTCPRFAGRLQMHCSGPQHLAIPCGHRGGTGLKGPHAALSALRLCMHHSAICSYCASCRQARRCNMCWMLAVQVNWHAFWDSVSWSACYHFPSLVNMFHVSARVLLATGCSGSPANGSMAPRCAKAGAKTRQRNRPPSRFRSGQVNPEFWRPDDPDLGRRLELESAMGGPTYDQSPAGLPLQPSRLATAPVEPALEEEADLGLVTGPFGTPPKPPPSKRQRQAADRRDTSPELVRADNNTTLSDHMGRQQPRSAAASPELLSDAAVQRGSFYVGFQGNTVRQRAMAEPDASSASQHPMIQVAANIPPQEISSDTSCDATSDDSSMSYLLRMRIPWRLTSWPLRCHGPGCTLPLSLRQAIRYIIQVSTACFSDGFTTNHSSLPGPKSGGGSRSTNALHFIVLILFSCVCGTSGVRVWGNAVQQPHEAVTSAQQHIPQSKPQRIRSRDPRVLSLLLLSTRIREHSNVPSNTDTLAIKVPCTHLPPSIVNTSPTRNRRRLAGPVWHRQCQACTSCSGTPVASPPLGWQSSSSGYTDQAPDVCLITESHWSSSCEYTQDSYHVINSGNGSWHGGVFVLIRKT